MERWEAKIVALLLIFFLPLIFTLLPYKLSGYFCKKGAKGKKVLSCLMCFGGGVFFATFMLHMGPEVRKILHESLVITYNIHFPIADLTMAAGFFIVLYIEKFAVRWNTNRQLRKKRKLSKYVLPIVTNGCPVKAEGSCIVFVDDAIGEVKSPVQASNDSIIANGKQSYCHCLATKEKEEKNGVDVTTTFLDNKEDKKEGMKDEKLKATKHHHHSESGAEGVVIDVHGTRSLILLLALSLHRIFDGMGVGLQQSLENVWNLLIAVVCHEVVIGFSLGLDFMKNNYTWKRLFLTAFLCSTIMPIGILIGIGISEMGNNSMELQIVNGVLQGVTCGTFIYVTFMEILHEELDAMETSLAKVTSVLVGFGLMAALAAVPEGSASAVVSVINETSTVSVLNGQFWSTSQL